MGMTRAAQWTQKNGHASTSTSTTVQPPAKKRKREVEPAAASKRTNVGYATQQAQPAAANHNHNWSANAVAAAPPADEVRLGTSHYMFIMLMLVGMTRRAMTRRATTSFGRVISYISAVRPLSIPFLYNII